MQSLQYYKPLIYLFTFVCENGICTHGLLVLGKRPEEGHQMSCNHSLPYSFQTGSLNERGVSWQLSSSHDPPGFISHSTELTTTCLVRPDLSHGCWDLNSGFHVCSAGTLTCLAAPPAPLCQSGCITMFPFKDKELTRKRCWE